MEDLKKEAQKLLDEELKKFKVNKIAGCLERIKKHEELIKEEEKMISNIERLNTIPSERPMTATEINIRKQFGI